MMTNSIRILILKDRHSDAELVLHELRQAGFAPDWQRVDTETDYIAALQRVSQTGEGIDAILADCSLPQFNALSALEIMQEWELDIPFIVIAGSVSEEVAVACMKRGASDYLLKDRMARLGPALEQALQEKRLRDEKRQAEKAMQMQNRALVLLNDATQAFIATLDPDRVFASVLGEVRNLLGVAASSIWTIDRETQEMVCRYATGPGSDVAQGWRLPPGEGIVGWVAQHGQSLILPDVLTDERHFVEIDRRIGVALRAVLSVPLRSRQAVIGVLQVLDTQVGRFGAADLQMLEPLAASAASAIENAWLYRRAQQEISDRKQAEEALAAERALLRTIIDLLPESVYAKDIEGRKTLANRVELSYLGVQTEAEALGRTDLDFYPEDVAASFSADDRAVLQDGWPLLDIEKAIVTSDGQRRWLLTSKIPLKDSVGKIVGLVGVGRDITGRRQAGEILRQYAERLRALRAIDGAVLAAQSPAEIANAALRHVQQLIPCPGSVIVTLDFQARETVVLAVHPEGESELVAGGRFPLGTTMDPKVLRRSMVSVVDTDSLPRSSPIIYAAQAVGARRGIVAPLIAHGELIGCLALGMASSDDPLPDYLDIAREVADRVALALYQARLREQVEQHAEELEQQVAARTAQLARRNVQLQVAAEVARDATTARDLDELLDRSVNLIRARFGFYHAGIFLVDERSEYAILRAATGEAGCQMLEHGHRLKVGQVGIVGYVTGASEPRIALDAGADAVHFDNPFLPDTRSEMALPMRVGGRVIGALDVQSTKESAFDDDDVEILQVMTDQLAVAIEKTRLFEQTQAALEERLQTVISNTPVVLFALNQDGVFTLSEGKGLEALNLKPGELVGRSALDVYRDVPQALEGIRRALAGKANTLTIEDRDLAFDAWYSPLRDESGEVTGVIGVTIDVTERQHLEEQMRRQEQLAAVGQLAGGIAHDFNNFLMTIIFYAHIMLRNKDLPPDLAAIAETIVGEAHRATDLVRQVLDFSRRSVMETEPVDLLSFIEEIVDILRKTLPENIRLLTEVGRDDYVVNADPTRIQQVVMNLALNARDAMPSGGELRIGLSKVVIGPSKQLSGISDLELSAGDWVCLSVSDTGTGMSEQVRAHLFEPFFTTKGANGTGLGLAQVYGIVKLHKGDIGMETESGRGTTFRVYLPACGGTETAASLVEETSDIPGGRGETILFVEDDEKVRDAGRSILEDLGYRVLTASNGQDGLDVFRSADKVNLVLTDMIMPVMGGRELIQELKRLKPDVKALIITGYTLPEDLEALRDMGFADVVHKPLGVNALGMAIRRILDADCKDE